MPDAFFSGIEQDFTSLIERGCANIGDKTKFPGLFTVKMQVGFVNHQPARFCFDGDSRLLAGTFESGAYPKASFSGLNRKDVRLMAIQSWPKRIASCGELARSFRRKVKESMAELRVEFRCR